MKKTFRSWWFLVLFLLGAFSILVATTQLFTGELNQNEFAFNLVGYIMYGAVGLFALYTTIRACFMRLVIKGDNVTFHGFWRNTSFRTVKVRPTTYDGNMFFFSWLPSFKRADNGEWVEFPLMSQYNFFSRRPPRSVRKICRFVDANLEEIRRTAQPPSTAEGVFDPTLASEQH